MRKVLFCVAVFVISSISLFGCDKQEETEVQREEIVEPEVMEAAKLPEVIVSENSQMKDFEIIVHGVEDERKYLDTQYQSEDILMTLTSEDEILLDAYSIGQANIPGYPITIKCIPNDGVEECADRLVVNCDFGGFYVREDEEFKTSGQEVQMQANYTCFYTPTIQMDGAISHSEISTIQIVAYKGEEAVKVIKLKVLEDEGNHYISILSEE